MYANTECRADDATKPVLKMLNYFSLVGHQQLAGKYTIPAWHVTRAKGLDEKALMASQWPSHPGDASTPGVWTHRLLRPPLWLLPTTTVCYTPWYSTSAEQQDTLKVYT